MAQGSVPLADLDWSKQCPGLTEKEQHELQQYQKIVRLRDAILSGTHPTIKLAPEVIASVRASSASIAENNRASLQANLQALTGTSAAQKGGHEAPDAPLSAKKQPSKSGLEINPILLQKSDDLVRAEIQIQRQRLERVLREEVDRRRSSKQAHTDSASDLDVADILGKALTLSQAPTAAPLNTDGENDASSDSFDDNTFYSSQHGTPESRQAARVSSELPEIQEAAPSLPQSEGASHRAEAEAGPSTAARPDDPRQGLPVPTAYPPRVTGVNTVPGLNNYPQTDQTWSNVTSQNASGEQSLSEDSVPRATEHHGTDLAAQDARQQLLDAYADAHPPSPMLRSHDVGQRVAQQSLQSLAPAAAVGPGAVPSAAPPQVAALRNVPAVVSSPESSSQGGRGQEKRKSKKKKRKADRQVPETDGSPYIKNEPRSPSPLSAPAYIRPSKRARQAHRQLNEPVFDDARYMPSMAAVPPPHQGLRPLVAEPPLPQGYDPHNPYGSRAASVAVVGESRYDRGMNDDERVMVDPYRRPQQSPAMPTTQYFQPTPYHGGRTASQVVVSDSHTRQSNPYREHYESSRISSRPESDQFMPATRPPAAPRSIFDAFGREYIEPPRPTTSQSVALPPRYGEPETLYERPVPAPRAVSRHPGPPVPYDEAGGAYGGPSTQYPVPRRVVTQPQTLPYEYRSYPEHAPPHPYGAAEAVRENYAPAIATMNYSSRAASVLPAAPPRYELPSGYGRTQSVHPEATGREYSMAPYHHHHQQPQMPPRIPQQSVPSYMRDAGAARPAEYPVVQPEYGMPTVERYYEAPPPRGAGEEIAFIERPREATQEIVYADDARRELYR